MKKHSFLTAAALFLMVFCVSCDKEKEPVRTPVIEGLTLENFPVMDGSSSTQPLIWVTASRLLGYSCVSNPDGSFETDLPTEFVMSNLKVSQTHNSFIRLLDGGADMIFSARRMSADEKTYAQEAGVELIETPIALDALVFMKNPANPANSLTQQQLQEIYTAKVKNWSEVGGEDMEMVPFVRNKNSGSQELMESLVMEEPIPEGFYEDHFNDFQLLGGMVPVFQPYPLRLADWGTRFFTTRKT